MDLHQLRPQVRGELLHDRARRQGARRADLHGRVRAPRECGEVRVGGRGYLKISIEKQNNEVDVCVKNHAEAQQINTLRREFALIHAGEPESVYLKKMEEAAMTEGQSRLGLIRILFEAGARLRLDVNDSEVSIHAIFPLENA